MGILLPTPSVRFSLDRNGLRFSVITTPTPSLLKTGRYDGQLKSRMRVARVRALRDWRGMRTQLGWRNARRGSRLAAVGEDTTMQKSMNA